MSVSHCLCFICSLFVKLILASESARGCDGPPPRTLSRQYEKCFANMSDIRHYCLISDIMTSPHGCDCVCLFHIVCVSFAVSLSSQLYSLSLASESGRGCDGVTPGTLSGQNMKTAFQSLSGMSTNVIVYVYFICVSFSLQLYSLRLASESARGCFSKNFVSPILLQNKGH